MLPFFVDDSKLRGRLSDLQDLKGACEEFHRFDRLSGQQLNGKKCRAFGTTSDARRAARALLPPDGCLVYHLVSFLPTPDVSANTQSCGGLANSLSARRKR